MSQLLGAQPLIIDVNSTPCIVVTLEGRQHGDQEAAGGVAASSVL